MEQKYSRLNKSGCEDENAGINARHWRYASGRRRMNYLLGFAMPNFHFHMTMTCALLRKGGVEIGKMDFIGSVD